MMDDLQIGVRLEDEPDIVYPSGDTDVPEIDGLKMEPVYSEVQQALIAHFADRDDVLVAGNSFVYFKVDGHPQRTWLDCFVALGVDRDAIGRRGCYYTWKTGKAPDFVLEIRTSGNAFRYEGEFGRRLYSALGIAEYRIVDITCADMDNRGLSGGRLVDGRYEEMALTTDAAGGVRGYSPTLGLSLCRRDDDRLRVHAPTDESCALNVAEERAARLAAEAENRRLRERLRRLRSQD